ncbi:hypothetical protein M2171_005545 [Bradyrhizobium japonicum USDA 38]|uniref:hypothetical protein n=1 Tax=Bradyrhizobium japonicum TaxID=375 RepID=UPI00048375E5|nr:hypothetical protein [Bradyrhizobium japonicum]MCS3896412.1 hypothetical protein [Bradyrhizobium japonicum USDA 38]MCS3948926.1 hypothetical protein [Bradyrhizobium japonicum]
MEYLKLLIELAKAIAWPVAVIAIGLMFKADVRALFPRLKKAGPTGFEFDPGRQVLAAPSKELKDLPGFPERSPMVAKVETDLHTELELFDPDRRIDLLIRNLAVARLATSFEQIHRTLFGSQLRSLRALAASENGAASRAEASSAFENQVKPRFPEFYEKSSFDEWVRYLITVGLVEMKADKIAITEKGRELLRYADAVGLSDDIRPN